MQYYIHTSTGNLLTEEMLETLQDTLLDDEGVTGQKGVSEYVGTIHDCPACDGEGYTIQVDPYSGMDDGGETCAVCGGSGQVSQKKWEVLVDQYYPLNFE